MSGSFAGWDEATLQRAADLVTGELTLEQELELRSTVDPLALEEFELAAGELSLLVRREDVPDDSARRIEAGIRLEIQRGAARPQGSHAAGRRSAAARGPLGQGAPRSKDARPAVSTVGLGWALALVMLSWIVLEPTLRSASETDQVAAADALLASASDAIRLDWAHAGDPLAAGVTGEIRWSNEAGAGTMLFQGLPVNDPAEAQYQLWIFDGTRPGSSARPVDGGVFDATGGETRVAIDARLPVGEATLFAVTLERPGGVVVSDREHLLLTATVD